MKANYSPAVKEMIISSREEAIRLNSAYLGAEHLFLGLILMTDEPAAKLIREISGDGLGEIKKELEEHIKRTYSSPFPESGSIPLTAIAEKILKGAYFEMLHVGGDFIQNSHFVLALLKQGLYEKESLLNILDKYGLNYQSFFNRSFQINESENGPEERTE